MIESPLVFPGKINTDFVVSYIINIFPEKPLLHTGYPIYNIYLLPSTEL